MATRERARALAGAAAIAVAVVMAMGSAARTAGAQLVVSARDSAAVLAAAAKADTGRMMPAYQDLSRYDSPSYCLAGMRRLNAELHRRNEQVVIEQGAPDDTMASPAVALGRRCVSQFSVARVSPLELRNLAALAVLIRDTALLQATIARRLSLETTVRGRGYVLADAIRLLATSNGVPFVAAPIHALIARLDSLGPAAAAPRYEAHFVAFGIAEQQHFDTTAELHEGATLRAIVPQLSAADQVRLNARQMMMDSAIVAWYRHPPQLPTVVRGYLSREAARVGADSLPRTATWINFMAYIASQVDRPAAALAGTYWFGVDSSHVTPAVGTVTLLTMVTKGDGTEGGQIAELMRLYREFAPKGLEIVMVAKTDGYSWASPPQTPADEAKTMDWYFHEYLKIPFPLVVYATKYAHDAFGRRVDEPIQYLGHYPFKTAIVGRDGRIYATAVGTQSESQLQAFIAQALAQRTPSVPQQ